MSDRFNRLFEECRRSLIGESTEAVASPADYDMETAVVGPWAEIMSASYLESDKIHVHCSADGEAECSELSEKDAELLRSSARSLLDYVKQLMIPDRSWKDSVEQAFHEVNRVAAGFGLGVALEKLDEEAQTVDFIIVAN